MDRRIFLGLSAAAIAVIGGGNAIALDGPAAPAADPVLALADLLETGYVIPEIGKRYAAMLRQKAAAGAYKDIVDPAELGQRLTADLLAVSPDRHLRVVPAAILGLNDRPHPRPADGEAKPQPPAASPPAPAGPQPLRRIAIEDAGWIAKDVAYIRFAGFPDDPDTAAVCNRFMREHATAKAVIIDARYNGGGGVVQMNAILPYLYSKPTVLVQMEMVDSIAKARGARRPPLLNKARFKFNGLNLDFSVEKARRVLGYDPPYTTAQGLERAMVEFAPERPAAAAAP